MQCILAVVLVLLLALLFPIAFLCHDLFVTVSTLLAAFVSIVSLLSIH